MRTIRQKRDMWIVEEDGKVVGIYNNEPEAKEAAGIQVRLTGAIVEESILDADLDGDGVIEKAELEEWLQKDEE